MARGYEGASATCSTRPTSGYRSALFFLRPARLAPPRRIGQPRPARPARVRGLAVLLQRRRHRRLGPARLPAAALPARAHAVGRLPRPRRGPAPVGAGDLAAIAALFLLGFRVGAQHRRLGGDRRRLRGRDRRRQDRPRRAALRRSFPDDNPFGDTYGPVNYYAYVPFELVFPWSGSWDDLPAAHAAAIFFDLAAFALLLRSGAACGPAPPAASSARSSPSPGPPIPTRPTPSSRTPTTRCRALSWSRLLADRSPPARGALTALAG